MKCGPSALMYASGKFAASELWAFRAVVHFRQAVVSAKSVWPKTMDPSKPETFMHLSQSMGEDLPVRFFCALSKRAQRYYLKLSINVSTRTIGSGVCCVPLLCAFKWCTRVIYPSRRVRVDQTSDHTRLTRRAKMRIFLT